MRIEFFRPCGRLRPARQRDVAPCAAIVQHWLDAAPWLPVPHCRADTEAWLGRVLFPRCLVRVAAGAEVRGFIAIDRRDMVQALYVAEDARAQGIGAALVERAKLLCPTGLTLWTHLPNLAARRFYARHGFDELRRTGGDNEAGVPDVLMGWQP